MAYDFEKEKREAMEAGNRALHSLREAISQSGQRTELGLVGYVWRWNNHKSD